MRARQVSHATPILTRFRRSSDASIVRSISTIVLVRITAANAMADNEKKGERRRRGNMLGKKIRKRAKAREKRPKESVPSSQPMAISEVKASQDFASFLTASPYRKSSIYTLSGYNVPRVPSGSPNTLAKPSEHVSSGHVRCSLDLVVRGCSRLLHEGMWKNFPMGTVTLGQARERCKVACPEPWPW